MLQTILFRIAPHLHILKAQRLFLIVRASESAAKRWKRSRTEMRPETFSLFPRPQTTVLNRPPTYTG
ncbi:hypothetical protein GBAR_LOCUS19125 [Geodia barretti]|uniref:Uncharacterized protein n=1 Tax=Geodia barretti TaxID=519541 RepID=A0AA35SRJ3_GEOBA|nr:hypothetical protein GBAR_LOCUS19125 [Geodia barretti]